MEEYALDEDIMIGKMARGGWELGGLFERRF